MMNLNKSLIRIISISIFLAVFVIATNALALTYIYSGNPFTDSSGRPDLVAGLGTSISATITTVDPILPNSSYYGSLITSWSIGDGVHSVSSDSPSLSQAWGYTAQFSTDSLGDISDWYIFVDNNSIANQAAGLWTYSFGTMPYMDYVSYNGPLPYGSDDFYNYIGGKGVTGNPGTWSVESSSVPEPSTFILLATGLVGVGLLRRRFKN